MLLGNKKSQSSEQNWCIILGPLRNELDKKKVALKISEVFSLSASESSDLVSNTPIILLDNLSRAVASRIKEYFQSSGAEMILTNDVFMKRKCYRTVWPEPPNLSFLQESASIQEASEGGARNGSEALAPQEALDELRSMSRQISVPAERSIRDDNPGMPGKSHEDAARWKRECELAREEAARLRGELAKKAADRPDHDKLQAREKEIRELKTFLSGTQEKYDAIREEYREARSLFEEKFSQAVREIEGLKKAAADTERKQQAALKEKQEFEEAVKWGKGNFHKLSEEYEKARKDFELQLSTQEREVQSGKIEMQRLTDALKTALNERQSMESALNEKEKLFQRSQEESSKIRQTLELKLSSTSAEFEKLKVTANEALNSSQALERVRQENEKRLRQLQDEMAQTRRGLEDKLALYAGELEQWKIKANEVVEVSQALEQEKKSLKDRLDAREAEGRRQADQASADSRRFEQRIAELEKENQRLKTDSADMSQKIGMLEKVRENLERLLREESAQSGRLREQHEKLVLRVQQIDHQLAEEKDLHEKTQFREKEMEKNQLRLIQELENRREEIRSWESRFSQMESDVNALRQTLEDREKMMKANFDLLDAREKELEAARRQVRDLNQQLEQREMIQKKNQLNAQLVEKEAAFKKLVADQEKIEQEMRAKEELMRQVLAQQEAIEKEIMEAKQAQRYILERAKRERPLSRIKVSRDSGEENSEADEVAETTGE